MLKRIGAEESGEFKAIASGTLPSGKPVVVNADGTVSVISSQTQALGSAVVFESATMQKIASAFDSNSNKIVLAYRDGGNSGHGTAIVGTISGSSVSFGTAVVFQSAAINDVSMSFDSTANKVVIAYNSSGGKAIVGTVSGTGISFGSVDTIDSGLTTTIQNTATVYDPDNNKTVVIVKDGGDGDKGFAYVGTVSGTDISFGSQVTMSSSSIGNSLQAVYDTNSNKVVVGYKDAQVVVGTVSGTSISFGSVARFTTNTQIGFGMTFDSANNKIVAAIGDYTDSTGKAFVGTVSGTSISFGSGVTFNAGETIDIAATFDPDAGKVVIAYRDSGNSNYGTVITGTVSGTSISFDSETVYESARAEYTSIAYDSNANKSLISYGDVGNSTYGTSIVFTTGFSGLTSENYIGMSPGDVTYDIATEAVGTEVTMNSGSTTGFAAAFDSSTGKVVIAFSDGTDGQKGKAIVGTVDAANNSISFGSEVTFQNSEITGDQMDCVFDSNANKVVIFYTDTNNPSTDDRTGTAIVGTVSGTSISFGTKAAFESGNTKYIVATFDSNSNKVVVAYEDDDNSDYGTAAVGTISGTDISFGTPVVFDSQATEFHGISFDSNANKVVIAYRDFGLSIEGRAVVGTVSGTSISFGSTVSFTSASADFFSPVYDSANDKTVIFYRDANNSDHGTAKVGTVSGTSISFGDAVVFNAGNSQYIRGVYDSNAGKILVLYKDDGNSNRPTIIIGTVSGTSISFGSETVVMDVEGATINPAVAFDSTNNKVVLSYIDTTGSDNGMAQVVQLAYDNTTRVNIADGNRTSINIIGSVVDNQNSLTTGQQYFVQTDGTISTTADDPSVLAGTAISATELLVKT